MPIGLANFAQEAFGGLTSGAKRCAPPRGFRGAEGTRIARPVPAGPFGSGPRPLRGSAAQKAGLRYEAKVLRLLKECFDGFQASQWFEFEDPSTRGRRWCQPDGLLLRSGLSGDGRSKRAFLFEVKIRATSDAWYQLKHLYAPVIQAAYQPEEIYFINICRSFDPSIPFPETPNHLSEISEAAICAGEARKLSVYTWKL